ncbi:hypothetical protein CTI12_AA452440 [Artemisia annua]|uniref:Uncharacterized protein n=1 Tax=Artemisia annua TaxID=35608 RepID=A0A2U1LUM6_ARTAN|nr:hypothetical protein CTI12_AA452440 [Artemisia annua]
MKLAKQIIRTKHQRAPSTFEEFKRLEEEMASHGVASQTIEKAKDGFLEAVTSNDTESVKESFKEDVGVKFDVTHE